MGLVVFIGLIEMTMAEEFYSYVREDIPSKLLKGTNLKGKCRSNIC